MTRDDTLALGAALAAAAGIGLAPPPPEVPLVRPDDLAAMDASLEAAAERARRYTARHGDIRIPWDEARGHLAIVVDDVGRSLYWFEALRGLRLPLTFNVLPGAPYASGVQQRILADPRHPREVWLHLPLAPQDPAKMAEDPFETMEAFLLPSDDEPTLRRKVEAALARVPLAVGVGPHMGSALTRDREKIRAVLRPICSRGLFFLDARTTPDTVAEEEARALGCPTARRDFFLDVPPDPQAVEAALARAAEASRDRPVVAIAHPSAAVYRALLRAQTNLPAEGVGVYPLSELLSHTRPPLPPSPDPGAGRPNGGP